jgi:hypothetical protein
VVTEGEGALGASGLGADTGITRFVAEILADNRAMLSVFHNAGFPVESKTECGTVKLTMNIAPDLGEAATD